MQNILVQTRNMPDHSNSDPIAESNHRIANSLTLLVSMVRMQAQAAARRTDPVSPADIRLALEAVAARIGTIGQLHRMLSLLPQDGTASLRPHLCEVTDTLVQALSSPEQTVRVEHTGDNCMVQMKYMQPLILIICEAFINAMKYAHPAGVPLVLTVGCRSSSDGHLIVDISDDGVGLPEGFDPYQKGGLGFRVIRSLAAEIDAELKIHSSELGLTFRLSIPAAAMAGTRLV